jgi:hypothetical protein
LFLDHLAALDERVSCVIQIDHCDSCTALPLGR